MSEFEGVSTLLNAVTTTVTGVGVTSAAYQGDKAFQAVVSGTGAVTATVVIQCSNDNVNFIDLGTITLTGTTTATDGFAASAAWAFHRAKVTAVSGTGAVVTVTMAS